MTLDSLGLIVALDNQDSLARQADFALCTGDTSKLALFEIGWGLWTRHPSRPANTCSRDQIITTIVVLGQNKEYIRLLRLLLRTSLRLGFCQDTHNTAGSISFPDWMLPFYGLFIRAFYPWSILFWPLLLIFDLTLLIGAIVDIRPWRDPEDTDDTNSIAQHIGSHTMPTPLSWLARKLYAKFRRQNYGNTINGESNPVMGAVSWYFKNPEFSGNADFIELYRPRVQQIS